MHHWFMHRQLTTQFLLFCVPEKKPGNYFQPDVQVLSLHVDEQNLGKLPAFWTKSETAANHHGLLAEQLLEPLTQFLKSRFRQFSGANHPFLLLSRKGRHLGPFPAGFNGCRAEVLVRPTACDEWSDQAYRAHQDRATNHLPNRESCLRCINAQGGMGKRPGQSERLYQLTQARGDLARRAESMLEI